MNLNFLDVEQGNAALLVSLSLISSPIMSKILETLINAEPGIDMATPDGPNSPSLPEISTNEIIDITTDDETQYASIGSMLSWELAKVKKVSRHVEL